MDLRLHGRTALVTGAASGIGRETAATLNAEGMRVALLDRDAAALAETATVLRAGGGDPVVVSADVTDETAVRAAIEQAVDHLGALHTVVCCAGISGPVGASIERTSRDEWDAVFAVNVTGTFLVLKHSLAALRRAEAASVVVLASDSASVASPGMVPYCASKAALVQFARALAVDLAADGIRVNAVSPSIVDTPMSRSDLDVAPGFAGVDFPVHTAAEIAAHVAYLASPLTRGINGTQLLADFGYGARSGFPA